MTSAEQSQWQGGDLVCYLEMVVNAGLGAEQMLFEKLHTVQMKLCEKVANTEVTYIKK